MDMQKLRNLLKATLDPDSGKVAEEELNKIKKIAGFGPSLLQMVMSEELDIHERQAAVIYLKNLITQSWHPNINSKPTSTVCEDLFVVHHQDKENIRGLIVDAIVHAPDIIRVQLCVCALNIIKHDFPHNSGNIVEKITHYLQNVDTNLWMGALQALYQLIKQYEYKKLCDREPQIEAMTPILPMLYERFLHLQLEHNNHNMLLQKMILKIFYGFTQLYFPSKVVTRPILTQWLEALRQILTRSPYPPGSEIPEEEEERTELPGWKLYKWALHILNRIFERYGCPSTVNSESKSFATWYLETFSGGILEVLMKLLEQHRNGEFVSPRVLHQILSYLEQGMGQSHFWKLIAPHMEQILKDIIFPLLCHNDKDQELWECDPVEYIRLKNDMYEDLISPVSAAQGLLLTCVRKRKRMLEKVMSIAMEALQSPYKKERNMDGAFHMIGTLGVVLIKKDLYKDQMESMIVQFVFPQLQSEHGFLRARAYWFLQHFTDIKWSINANLGSAEQCAPHLSHAVNSCIHALLTDSDMPVQVEAALAISLFIASQERTEELLVPRMSDIVRVLIKLIQETENDDLTTVMTKFVTAYSTHLAPIAVDIARQVSSTFQQVINSEGGADDRAITAMSLLNTLERLLNAMEDAPEITSQLEPILFHLIVLILDKGIMEYYEEALSMIYNLTINRISPDSWQCFNMLIMMFNNDGYDYFMEMLPSLHNFVTVDTAAFLSVETRLPAICQMCQHILDKSETEDDQTYAAKLLEVVILQCSPNPVVLRDIVTLVINRILDTSRGIKCTEFRMMLLQVIIAALFSSCDVMLSILDAPLPNQNGGGTALQMFLKQWLDDIDCFLGLHDRKLSILGLCTLLQLGPDRVPALQTHYAQIMPAILELFQGLKAAYAAKAADENEEDDDSDTDSSDLEEIMLESDEDELHENEGLLEGLEKRIQDAAKHSPFNINTAITLEGGDSKGDEDEDSESDLISIEDIDLESYSTPLDKEDSDVDEYWVFKSIMQSLEGSPWFNALTEKLSNDQKEEILEVATLADQRRAAMESRKIQQSGGYNFQQVNVPSTFNFGGSFGGGN